MDIICSDRERKTLGFKGDFFSEVLHNLRSEVAFTDYVNLNMQLTGCKDLRDKKAITRLASAYLKILFPDLNLTREEFVEFCVKPSVELRQRVRDELHKMDKEYGKVSIGVVEE